MEFDANALAVPVWYCKWHRKKELPLRGYYILTVQEGADLVLTEVGEWAPDEVDGAYRVDFDCGHALTFTHQSILDFSKKSPRKKHRVS
jgi:hypothetical protein